MTMAPEQTITLNMEQLAVLLRNAVDAAVGPINERIDRISAGQSKIVKKPATDRRPTGRTYEPPEELRKRMRGPKGYEAMETSRWLDTPQGRRALPEEYWPAFRPGDLVRINPDVVPRGDTRPWSEILPKHATNKEGLGEIISTMHHGKSWEPKYKVAIAGFSGGDCGLWESELLPYEPEDY